MNTEELGNVIEEWKTANWNYVTKEQCKKFRNEFENETENEDIKAIIENIKEHMVTHNWEYTPVSEEVSEEVEVVSTTEEVNDDSAGDKKEKQSKVIDIYIYAEQLKNWDKDTADEFFKEDETLKKKEEAIDKKIKAKNKYLKSINKQIEKEQLALAKMQLDFLILTK